MDNTEIYNLENTLKNMYEKEMKRKRRNEYMRKYMAQKRQDEKRQTQWKTQQELPINGNIYETKSSRQIHLKNVERDKIKNVSHINQKKYFIHQYQKKALFPKIYQKQRNIMYMWVPLKPDFLGA